MSTQANDMTGVRDSEYVVVFKGTGETSSNYEGIITWTVFSSKEEFERQRKLPTFTKDTVLAEGVSEEEAVALVHSTTDAARFHAAVRRATREDGSVDVLMFLATIHVIDV